MYKQTTNKQNTRLTALSRYQKGKTNVDFTEAKNSKWHWHQLGRMQVCTSLQTTPAPNHCVLTNK